MLRIGNFATTAVLLSTAIWFVGCSAPDGSGDTPAPAAEADGEHAEGEHEHADGEGDAGGDAHTEGEEHSEGDADQSSVSQPEVDEALAKLSEADRALAVQQKVCLVGGGVLGAMGTPVKVDIEGQTAFICCENCQAAIEKDPSTYLAKLQKIRS